MAAGTDPFRQQAPTPPLPVLRQQEEEEGWVLPLCQLHSFPLLAAGIARPCSLPWGANAQCCPLCPGPALLRQLQCCRAEQPAKGGRVLQPRSAQPGLGERARLGGSGTELVSLIKPSNKASRCLGRDGAWRCGMCLNNMFIFSHWYWLRCELCLCHSSCLATCAVH